VNPVGSTSEETAALLKTDIAKYRAKAANLKAD